jgi:hypothetical protein
VFEQCVDKVADVRTAVIGQQVFSVRIDSPHLDWRRERHSTDHAPNHGRTLPRAACITAVRKTSWALVEQAHATWHSAGRPAKEIWTIKVDGQGRTTVELPGSGDRQSQQGRQR